MEWSVKYKVDVDYLDNQHQRIVEYITEAEGLLKRHEKGETVSKSEVQELITKLAEYTKVHFKDEETLMKRHNLRNLNEHLAIHANLIKQIGLLSSKIAEHGAAVLPILVKFLVEWLTTHIMGVDKTYSDKIGQREVP